MLIYLFLLFQFLVALAHCFKVSDIGHDDVKLYSLNGNDWSVRNTNSSVEIQNNCRVPGDIYTDLQNNNIIKDPYYRYGVSEYRWVAYENWTYTKKVSLDKICKHFKKERHVKWLRSTLVFKGLQVVSNIYLNNTLLTVTEPTHNEHLEYRFDITDLINKKMFEDFTKDTVVISVAFESSVAYGRKKFNEYNFSHKPDAPDYVDDLKYRNMVRTEQSSFGWDWGPAFAPQGILRDVYIEFIDYLGPDKLVGRISEVVPHSFPLPINKSVPKPLSDERNEFLLSIDVNFELISAKQNTSFPVDVIIDAPSLNVSNKTSANISPEEGMTMITIQLYIKNVPLWWPQTLSSLGRPTMHKLFVKVRNDLFEASTVIETGVRSIELVTFGDPLFYEYSPVSDTEKGTINDELRKNLEQDLPSNRPVMFFRVNGVPIFAKGANFIPVDAFNGRVNDTVLMDILLSAKAANMNMVRVWGGGLFPTDSFYEIADNAGIMVWQEMMFACAEYPIDPPFLHTVREEISYQLRRLGKHPSIVIWSGNNENGVYDKGPGSPYEILDYDTVLSQVIREDTSRPIWPASPSNGFAYGVTSSGLPAGTQKNPLPFKVGGKSGDTHWYNYLFCPSVSMFPKTNFASEYGFQSLPWFDNIVGVSEPEDWYLFSKLMLFRQHLIKGNFLMAALLTKNFKVPDLNSTDLDIFMRVIFLSQLQQVICIAEESMFYKRGRDMPYRTMGSLYWQLNQIWQAPSWTSLEYGGEWKILHYAMRKVYGQTLLSAFYNGTTDSIIGHFANDITENITGLTVEIQLVSLLPYSANKKIVVDRIELGLVPPLRGVFFWNMKKATLIKKYHDVCDSQTCFLYFKPVIESDLPCEPYTMFLDSIKNIFLDNNTKVSVKVLNTTDRMAHLTVSIASQVQGPAVFVMLRSKIVKGIFDKNLLTIFPGDDPIEIIFSTKLDVSTGKYDIIPNAKIFQSTLIVEYLNQGW